MGAVSANRLTRMMMSSVTTVRIRTIAQMLMGAAFREA